LDGALLRSKAYINDKFKAAKTASVIGSTRGFKHEQGRKDGVAAANKVTLGARAINAAAARKQIG
jgi:hypothetical protein